MIPTRNLRVGNIRNPKSSLGRVLAIAAVAVPAGGLAMCGPAPGVQAAGPSGTLVTVQDDPTSDDDQVVAIAPDGSASHVVAYGSPLSSVSMSNDGTIYIASDDQYTDDDHMWTFAQNGSLLDSWQVPNAGQGELYGGISDSEVRRDGARLISQSIWSNCNGGGLSEICNVRDVTEPGSATSLGDMINENGAAWLGNSDYIVVDGGLSYYKVGAEDSLEWFEDTEVWRQYDGSVGTTADGSLMAVDVTAFHPETFDSWAALALYRVAAAPPAAPTKLCTLGMDELIGEPLSSGYVDGVSFSPTGDALAFAAGADWDDMAAYVVNGLNADSCSFTSVTQVAASGVKDLYWGHFGYDPNHGPVDPGNPGNPGDPGDPGNPGDPGDPGQGGTVVKPVSPARFWDTRPEATFDGQAGNTGRLAGGQTYALQIGGRGSVPADAAGVVANLTVVNPDGPGFATLYPCTPERPTASHLNYAPGSVLANNAVIPLSADGKVCVFTKAGADFVLDVNGFVPKGSALTGINPTRFLDTRDSGTPIAGGTHVEIQVAGRDQVPGNAVAALVNVTAVGPSAAGYVTLYPCGERPGTSTVNYGAGDVVPNGAFVTLSPTGTVCAFTKADTHLLLDVAGFVPAGVSGLTSVVPARLLDTRAGQPTVDNLHAGTGRLAAGGVIEVAIAGRGNVPTSAKAALFNVAVVGPDGPGYATLYPCGTRPTASNVNNAGAGVVRANNAMTQLSSTGTVCIFTKAGTDVILDVTGWVG